MEPNFVQKPHFQIRDCQNKHKCIEDLLQITVFLNALKTQTQLFIIVQWTMQEMISEKQAR